MSAGNASVRSIAWGFGASFRNTTRAAAGRLHGDAAAGFRYRDDGDRAAVGFGARKHVFAGADARVPGRGRGPAVVDQQRERRSIRRRSRRQDSTSVRRRRRSRAPRATSRSSVSHQGVRAGVSSLGAISNSNRAGGKLMPARTRRDQPQQPPQHRQAQQSEQHQRLRETKRQSADHALASAFGRGVAGCITGCRRLRPCAHAAPAQARSPGGRCDG